MSNWSLRQKLRESVIEAVNRGDRLQVETLLNKGADVNESEGGYLSKRTLLIIAVERGHVDIASDLVARGANLSATVMVNKRGVTALDIATDKELISLVKVIEMKMEMNERLLSAVQDGNADQVQEALSNGANINILHKDGGSPQLNLLFLALSDGHVDVASILIQRGIDLHFAVAYPDQPKEDTAKSYAQRLNQDNLVNLIEQKIARQDAIPDANPLKESLQVHQEQTKVVGSKVSGELVDIEDTDLEEETAVELDGKQQREAGKSCTVS